MGGITTSKGLTKDTGSAVLVAILRIIFGVEILNGGLEHLAQGQATFQGILMGSGTGIGAWVAANSGIMWPLVSISMILTGISLILGLFGRLGAFAQLLFAVFFMLGVNSYMGNLAMLGAAIGFIIIGPGRYFGLDAYLLERVPALKFLA
jgi:uncharacterized membrane protein YphA (DoxX/SURF4 family)